MRPHRHFTVGIDDDVSGTSLAYDPSWRVPQHEVGCLFYGLGSDGTVGANKNSAKIIAEEAGRYVQAYFVYDSKKSGAVTVSHLRFGDDPIEAPYLIEEADFVACHQFQLLERLDVLEHARPGATFLLSSPYGRDSWQRLPRSVQEQIVEKQLRLYVVDAKRVAREAGLAGTCEHDPADLLLRSLRRAARRGGDRGHQARDREDATAARARRWSGATSPRSTEPSPRCSRSSRAS